MAQHVASHKKETSSPYICQYNECGVHHADLYRLAMHEERCQYRVVRSRQTCYRFAVTEAADRGEPATVIIVVRSSSHLPKSWFAHTKTIQQGLPVIGPSIAKEFADLTGIEPRSCVLHSCSDCATGIVHDEAFLERWFAC